MNLDRRTMLSLLPTGVLGVLIDPPNEAQDDDGEDDFRPKDFRVETLLKNNTWSTWYHYDEALGTIAYLPEWPADRDFTPEEWGKYLNVAHSLQLCRPEAVEILSIVAMLTTDWYVPSESLVNHWRTGVLREMNSVEVNKVIGAKLMILFRLMFDIPLMERAVHFEESSFILAGCGYYWAEPIEDGYGSPAAWLSSPVVWENGKPRLVAGSRLGEPGGMAYDYQPHIEYRYFREHFPARRGLEKLAAKDEGFPLRLY